MSEIVLITGYPAAGKTTLVQEYLDKGYLRCNKDVDKLKYNETLLSLISQKKDIVVDNTFGTKESRADIIKLANDNKYVIKCVWLNTSAEDAQANAVHRMIKVHGKFLSPDEISKAKDVNTFPPAAIFAYRKTFKMPNVSEGFNEVRIAHFSRNSYPSDYINKALILDYDSTLRTTISGEHFPRNVNDIKILPGRKELLQHYLDKRYLLLGVSNQSGVAKKLLSYQDAVDCFEHTNALLGHKIDYKFCPHGVPPIICYCRKPMAGLGIDFIHKYKLHPQSCIFVGDATSDKTFAERAGFQFKIVNEFFV